MKSVLMFLAILILLFSTACAEWSEPHIPAPYDYIYSDENHQIVIDKVSEMGITWFVADIQISSPDLLIAGYSSDDHRLTTYSKLDNLIFAINADDVDTHHNSIIIRHGEILRAKPTNRQLMLFYEDGSMSGIVDYSDQNPEELAQSLLEQGVKHVFAFGPNLIQNGEPCDLSHVKFINTDTREAPRTAFGMVSPCHYIALVIDGRRDGYSVGATVEMTRDIMMRYNVVYAFNLDGGGSSEMVLNGEVISWPSDGERAVYDYIGF